MRFPLRYEPTNEVMNECIDVANYCMFIWDILAKGKDNRENLVSRGSKQDANEAG